MTAMERELFLRVALAMRMIDLGQFNAAQKELRMGPSEDAGRLLLRKGYITEDQYREISSAIEDSNQSHADAAQTLSAQEPAQGEQFTIKHLIGQGGAGRVFLATDRMIGREVAVKEVLPAKLGRNRDYHLTRFIREAKISGRLEHPGVVPVYELRQKPDGTYFYVMKYVQGRTLFHAIMEDSEAATPEAALGKRLTLLDRLIDVAEAMGYAHAKGVIHRDLKPSNVVLGEFGETVILDWGLAKHLTDDDSASGETSDAVQPDDTADGLTRDGAQLGTPSYMAPEQIDPSFGTVNASTDVYTLGVLLFMILTGDKPYPGRGEKVMERILESECSPSPREYLGFIPPELSAICEKAMARRQEERFQNAQELANELKAYRDGRLVSVYAYSTRELLRRFVLRNKAAVVASILLLLSIVIGSGITTNYAVEAHRAKAKAQGALEEVTSLSESTMLLVRSKAHAINVYFETLEKNMAEATTDISRKGFGNSQGIEQTLTSIAQKHPETSAFLLIDLKGNILDAAPATWTLPQHVIDWEIRYLRGERRPDDGDVSPLFDTHDGHKAFVLSLPVMKGGKLLGGLTALMQVEKAIPVFLDFDPRKSSYQVWLMKDDGLIVYDEDEKQVGLNLFTAKIYQGFPELKRFGEQIRKQPWGIGHYSFLEQNGRGKVYKVAAWDTLKSDGTEWKLVATHEYASE